MSEETATIDPKDVRTQLGLAADAPDADVIVELLKLIAQLTAQIESLTGQAAQSEKELASRLSPWREARDQHGAWYRPQVACHAAFAARSIRRPCFARRAGVSDRACSALRRTASENWSGRRDLNS